MKQLFQMVFESPYIFDIDNFFIPSFRCLLPPQPEVVFF
jgi:hypothetical protein